jgi:hypothetical protein
MRGLASWSAPAVLVGRSADGSAAAVRPIDAASGYAVAVVYDVALPGRRVGMVEAAVCALGPSMPSCTTPGCCMSAAGGRDQSRLRAGNAQIRRHAGAPFLGRRRRFSAGALSHLCASAINIVSTGLRWSYRGGRRGIQRTRQRLAKAARRPRAGVLHLASGASCSAGATLCGLRAVPPVLNAFAEPHRRSETTSVVAHPRSDALPHSLCRCARLACPAGSTSAPSTRSGNGPHAGRVTRHRAVRTAVGPVRAGALSITVREPALGCRSA